MQTPVVLLIFNRPDTTRRVLEVVRAVQPSTLLVVADGPRPHVSSDEERCAETRALIDGVDWACDVRRNYADANMGLADRVAGGLTWAFEQVESAIILEDDCVPHPSFFRFCAELLDRYAADTRIMSISGTNYQLGRRRTVYSYYFSRYNHCWGWATWRRAWQFYDHDMTLWPDVRDGGWLYDILDSRQAVRYWRKILQRTYTGRINSWAYRWTLAHWLQSGLSILPNVNLVSNIGFGDQATHTRDRSPFAHMPAVAMPFPLSHPPFVIADAQADRHTQATVYREPPLPARALYRLRLLLAARQKSG
jgi:hypothetical protein